MASDEPYMNLGKLGCWVRNWWTSSSGFHAKRNPRTMTEDSVTMSIAPMTSLSSDDSRTPRMLSQMRKRMRRTVSAAQMGLMCRKGPMFIAYSRKAGMKKLMYPAEAAANRAMSMV